MRGALATVAVALLLIAGCAGPSVAPYEQALDALEFPVGWEVVDSVSKGSGGADACLTLANPNCPSVTRYYLAPGGPVDAYGAVQLALGRADFSIDEEVNRLCDVESSGPVCSMVASKGQVRLQVNVHEPGEDVDQLGIEREGRSVVRIIARQR